MPHKSTLKFTILRISLLALAICVPAYLAGAAAWSSAAFDDAIAAHAAVPPVPLSARQTAILLQVEDPAFFQHAGLSLASGQGLTTISSAVARELYLSDGQLPGLKGALQRFYRGAYICCKKVDFGRDVMALVLNAKLSKQDQLAMYAGTVYMGSSHGEQIRGLAQAAASYLGKPLAQMSEQEFIGLVAMIKAPNLYHPGKNPAAHAQRSARIAALVAGRCQPAGWFDTAYSACQ